MLRISILPAIHQLHRNGPFTSKKMVHHHITTEISEATSMKSYQVNGQDKEVALSLPHTHLI